MPYRLEPTQEYLRAKEALSRNARVALGYVEDGIREDPDHRVMRRDHLGVVVDFSAQDLLVAFLKLDGATVRLIEVMDRRSAPLWWWQD